MPMPTLFKWSPRPDQAPVASPASQSSSRFSALHTNVRSMVNGSSIYSRSPGLNGADRTPKTPLAGFFRREHSPPAPIDVAAANNPPRASTDSRSPLHPQHTAGSYMRSIAPFHDPRAPESVYRRNSDVPDRHPADVPLEHRGSVDPETEVLSDEVQHRRRRRRHRRRKHHQHGQRAWVRRKNQPRGRMTFVRGSAARGKLIASLVSGLFLAAVLGVYLALALTRRDLGQEVHILFIMIVLGTTIFFCHALIRLCMLLLHPPSPSSSPSTLPNMSSPDGFVPARPIRVHLARDAELADTYASSSEDEDGEDGQHEREKDDAKVAPPPPAYGLWRSSVRVDPNLLHWQRVEPDTPVPRHSAQNSTHSAAVSRRGSEAAPAEEANVARPPSYVSDDGVGYAVDAAPRSVVAPSHSGVSDIHPAWRPGYAV